MEDGRRASKTRVVGLVALSTLSAFFLVFNFVGGLVYTWLKFDVLGHSQGTGVVPGPWLVVPVMALGVFPAALVIGAVALSAWRLPGRDGGIAESFLGAFVVCSVAFHAVVLVTIVLPPDNFG